MVDDILDQIQSEHKIIQNIFELILEEPIKDQQQQSNLFSVLKKNLLPHIKSEEKLFYPLLTEHSDTKETALEALEEHRVAEMVLKELEQMSPSDERWIAKLTVLSEFVNHHIEEKEDAVFKGARDIIPQEERINMLQSFAESEESMKSTM
ncbi:hemerythrin domain-containing protein [Chitinispirillales bacterium ANBcel5]|uniref:hemerythrin domain-containing protein n=1 Tax=Cellulosispirillum alkaliphilum TaxID=3039283 RepID=UPI002A565D0D|nr:hemerythrin domain-containing protein [Chitinispirillales bacterium ANBcel5]